MFPGEQWGQANLILPQSSANLETVILQYQENSEPIAEFAENSRYRALASPVGRLEMLWDVGDGEQGVTTCTAWLVPWKRTMMN